MNVVILVDLLLLLIGFLEYIIEILTISGIKSYIKFKTKNLLKRNEESCYILP